MNKDYCPFCMSAIHWQAVVCSSCGARKKAYVSGWLILGPILLGWPLLVPAGVVAAVVTEAGAHTLFIWLAGIVAFVLEVVAILAIIRGFKRILAGRGFAPEPFLAIIGGLYGGAIPPVAAHYISDGPKLDAIWLAFFSVLGVVVGAITLYRAAADTDYEWVRNDTN